MTDLPEITWQQIADLFVRQRKTFVFEDIIQAIYTQLARKTDCLIDGGANIGDHTVPMSKLAAAVYAFEPVPHTVEMLRERLRKEGATNVEIRSVALADRPGRSSFKWVQNRATQSGLRDRVYNFAPKVQEIDVELVTLDSALTGEGRPIPFIKLDLEGGEYHALLGALQTLRTKQSIVVFENGGPESAASYGYTAEEFFALFRMVDYALFDLIANPFGPAQWGNPRVPYYLIAGPSGSPALQTAREVARAKALTLVQDE